MEPFEVPLWVLYALPTPLTVIAFTKIALPHTSAFGAFGSALRDVFSTRGGRLLLLLIVVLVGSNSLESIFDPRITEALGYDLTAWVRNVEGDWIERVQAPIRDSWPIAAFLTWAYVCAYVAILFAPTVIWNRTRDYNALREQAFGFSANYLLALPFYLLVPVKEVAWSGISDALPLMETVFRGISAEMRYESALDNCFPSLHVSCSLTAAIICHRNGPTNLRWLGWIVAGLTIWAVMALGVHWGLDVVAGVPFGMLNAWLGVRVARRFGRD